MRFLIAKAIQRKLKIRKYWVGNQKRSFEVLIRMMYEADLERESK